MNFSTIINSIGLSFDIVGAIIIFIFVPSMWKRKGTSLRVASDSDINKDKIGSSIGLTLIIIGFVFQLVSNFIK